MRLSVGQVAPDFTINDSNGKSISLADYAGKNVLVSFFRYAGCPFCNLTLIELVERYQNFASRGLEAIVFFQSDDESIKKYVSAKKPPFPLIADSKKVVYEKYGIESSKIGAVKSILRAPTLAPALLSGKVVQGKIDGDGFLMPAQFIVGPDQRFVKVYYGSDFMDKMPFFEIEEVIMSQSMKTTA